MKSGVDSAEKGQDVESLSAKNGNQPAVHDDNYDAEGLSISQFVRAMLKIKVERPRIKRSGMSAIAQVTTHSGARVAP